MRHLLLLSLLFFTVVLSGQRTISGTVVNATDGEPLVFVHVFLKGEQSHGVITNEQGSFSIRLSEEQLADELVFSLLGYQTHYEPLDRVTGSTFNLKMERSFIALEEVVVTSDIGLRAIIRKAIEKIPENYGHSSYLIQAYYRQYAMTDDTISQYTDGMITYKDRAYDNPERPAKGWVDHFRASDNFRHERFRGENPDYNPILGFYEFFNPVRKHHLHFVVSAMGAQSGDGEDPLLRVPLHHRGAYVEAGDTLVRIAYDLFPVRSRNEDGSNGPIQRYLWQGEVLINLSDHAILRNTIGKGEQGFYDDAVYRKFRGKYYPERIQWSMGFEHDYGTRKHYVNNLLYFHNILTTKAEIKAYQKGKLMLHGQRFDAGSVPFDPAYWAQNTLLQRVARPENLKTDLNRLKNLEQQYRDNAKRVVD